MMELKELIEVIPLFGPGVVGAVLLTGLLIKMGRDMFGSPRKSR